MTDRAAQQQPGITIIFSTVDRMSPSRSDNLEFSGTILEVSILGSPGSAKIAP